MARKRTQASQFESGPVALATFYVICFPSMEKARAWYDSPEYQEVLPIRLDANRDKMVIFEGL
jgi:uncharacterized protein (DUF1330 family)